MARVTSGEPIKLKKGEIPPAFCCSILEFCEELQKQQSKPNLTAKNLKKRFEVYWGKNSHKGSNKKHLQPIPVAVQDWGNKCQYFDAERLLEIRDAGQIGELTNKKMLLENLKQLRQRKHGGYQDSSPR